MDEVSCPKCGKGIVKIVKQGRFDGVACSQTREECGFTIFRNSCGVELRDEDLLLVARGQRTGLIKGMVAPKGWKNAGHTFDAHIQLDPVSYRTRFV